MAGGVPARDRASDSEVSTPIKGEGDLAASVTCWVNTVGIGSMELEGEAIPEAIAASVRGGGPYDGRWSRSE